MNNIPGEFILMFLGMVFIAVFLLSQSVAVPVFGEAGKVRKRIRGRLHVLEKANNQPNMQTVLRQKYLTRLSPLEARLEQLPFMEALTQMIEQSGHEYRAYRVLLLGLVLGGGGGNLDLDGFVSLVDGADSRFRDLLVAHTENLPRPWQAFRCVRGRLAGCAGCHVPRPARRAPIQRNPAPGSR